jgi:hypothetical protein
VKWVDDSTSTITFTPIFQIGQRVSYPYDKRSYGFGWVVSEDRSRVTIECGLGEIKIVEKTGVVSQERGGGESEGCERYDGGRVENGIAEDKGAEKGSGSGEEEGVEGEEGEWC